MNTYSRLILCVCCFGFLSTSGFAAKPDTAIQHKPDAAEALSMLRQGNSRFSTGNSRFPHADTNRISLAGNSDQGRFAFATVLSCSDSRVPVELLFDAGIMDIFVVRTAGNLCNGDEIGSIEYGLAHVHTPLLVVLGHSRCGAVAAAVQAAQGDGHALERNIQPIVNDIIPAVTRAMQLHTNLVGAAILPCAIEENVWHSIENLFMQSPATRILVTNGTVKVVAALYDLASGIVTWLPDAKTDAILKRIEASPAKQTEPFAPLLKHK